MQNYTSLDMFSLLIEDKRDVGNYNHLFSIIREANPCQLSAEAVNNLKTSLRKFCFKLKQKYIKAYYNKERFLKCNREWLETNFKYPHIVTKEFSKGTERCESKVSCRKPFENLSDRHKIRKTEEIVEKYSSTELLFAAKLKLKKEGLLDAFKVVEHVMNKPNEVANIRECCENRTTKPKTLPRDTGLALFVSLNLRKFQYCTLRQVTSREGWNIFPSYYMIQQAKLECYPLDSSIKITEKSAEITLQNLLDHTASRICKSLQTDEYFKYNNLVLISKWGFDGACGQSFYKQKFLDSTGDDSNILATSLVPIKLYSERNKLTLWENKTPSSTRYCRPIKFEYVRETKDVIKKEVEIIQRYISELLLTQYRTLNIDHRLVLTMIDGKICNTLTDTSSMRCYICNVRPSEMNDLEKVKTKASNDEFFSFGLSTLHLWIRSMEWILHVSYNMYFKKWSASTNEHASLKLARKYKIQKEFRSELGLLVDVVKQGVGNTNDGNTARKFFSNFRVTSKITSFDDNIIQRMHTILTTVSCGLEISAQKFKKYAEETARLYVSLYGWYYMPPRVHKVLMHGAEIIQYAIVPIGKLSEEASEARHKELRKCREGFSRKISRCATNEDVMNRLLLWSDLYISGVLPRYERRKLDELSPEVQELLSFSVSEIMDSRANFVNV